MKELSECRVGASSGRELKEERRRDRQAIITAQDGILHARSTNSSDPNDV